MSDVQKIIDLFRTQNEVVLAGAAGTGKTTLVSDVIKKHGNFTLMAPTAAAARRLSDVTGQSASTIHSVIYKPPSEDDSGNPNFRKIKKFGGRNHLVVVDECSMVGQHLYNDIMRASLPGTRFLWVGDENQLSPVGDQPGINLAAERDIHLTTVHRSAGDILHLAQEIIRSPAQDIPTLLRAHSSPHIQVLSLQDLMPSYWGYQFEKGESVGSYMMITHQNELRFKLNWAVRKRLGYPDTLVENDKLLVRSNHQGLMIYNGERLTLKNFRAEDTQIPNHYKECVLSREDKTMFNAYLVGDEFTTDGQDFRTARRADSDAWKKHLRENEVTGLRWQREQLALQAGEDIGLMGPAATTAHCHYGYSVTCHAAQGSEADHVGVVWNSNWMFQRNPDDAKRWFYTAVTRAKQSLKIWFL